MIGLYQDTVTEGWFLPTGTAPSTHVLKACTGEFPEQTINEALCMKAAGLCDLEVPKTHLIDCGGAEPFIVSRRFDRPQKEPALVVSSSRETHGVLPRWGPWSCWNIDCSQRLELFFR